MYTDKKKKVYDITKYFLSGTSASLSLNSQGSSSESQNTEKNLGDCFLSSSKDGSYQYPWGCMGEKLNHIFCGCFKALGLNAGKPRLKKVALMSKSIL